MPIKSVQEHTTECAHAAKVLKYKLHRWQREYPYMTIEELIEKAEYLADELHETWQIYKG